MDIDLTQSEIDNLSRAMKKPEFINLLNEYVDEISDPKNKAEHEAYLKQLEDSGELPQGRKLLRPAPHSCLKTFSTSKRNIKVFINLCQAEEIMAPNLDRQKGGGNWKVPYAMGHPRHDQDRKGLNCLTFDCAFHPMAFQIANGSSKFMKLLCDTSIGAANTLLQAQGEKVSDDYKVMRNLKCKGSTPGSIMVNEHRLLNPNEPVQEREKTYKLSEEGPKLYKELMSTQIKQKKEEEEEALRRTREKIIPEAEDEQEEEEVLLKGPTGIAIPKHKLVYSSPVDLGEFIDSRFKSYKRPKEAVLTIQIPLVENIKECNIDVKEKMLIFSAGSLYYLEVKLNYDVEEDKAQAKFDRRRKELKVTLPIIQPPEIVHEIAPDVPLEVEEEIPKPKPEPKNQPDARPVLEPVELPKPVEQPAPLAIKPQEEIKEFDPPSMPPPTPTNEIPMLPPPPPPCCLSLQSPVLFSLL